MTGITSVNGLDLEELLPKLDDLNAGLLITVADQLTRANVGSPIDLTPLQRLLPLITRINVAFREGMAVAAINMAASGSPMTGDEFKKRVSYSGSTFAHQSSQLTMSMHMLQVIPKMNFPEPFIEDQVSRLMLDIIDCPPGERLTTAQTAYRHGKAFTVQRPYWEVPIRNELFRGRIQEVLQAWLLWHGMDWAKVQEVTQDHFKLPWSDCALGRLEGM